MKLGGEGDKEVTYAVGYLFSLAKMIIHWCIYHDGGSLILAMAYGLTGRVHFSSMFYPWETRKISSFVVVVSLDCSVLCLLMLYSMTLMILPDWINCNVHGSS